VPHRHAHDPHQCRFGRWYYGRGHGRQNYVELPAFARIETPHLRVHEIAVRIDQLWREGRIEDARAQIKELLATRDEVLAALWELELAVGVKR
jgi:hypothetical protein